MWFFYLHIFINMKLINLLNEIIDEAIGDFNLGGIRGGGVTAGKIGAKISDLRSKLGGVSATKGLGGVYKSSKQAQKALTNLGMSSVKIGGGIKSDEVLLSFSKTDNASNSVQYLLVTSQVLTNIQKICQLTGNEFKQSNKLYQVKAEKTGTNLLYELKENGVMYYGMNNTTGKFYVPTSYANAPTTTLAQEDDVFFNKLGLDPNIYKVYKFSLVVKP